MHICFKNSVFSLSQPRVMGIVNLTPDSFYDGGKFSSISHILQHVERICTDGVDIIDVGAYSSRPGAEHISEQEEAKRLLPVVQEIAKHFPHIPLSIDSFRSSIIQQVYDVVGDVIVNDISGGMLDASMIAICGKLQLPYICMHMPGTPQTMQQHTQYTDILLDILQFFSKQIALCKKHGVPSVILDPGFGFGKTIEQNFTLLSNLQSFEIFEKPILVGLSRKSMIYKTLDSTPEDALHGTGVLHTIALCNKAHILRVHDVKEAKQCITLVSNIL